MKDCIAGSRPQSSLEPSLVEVLRRRARETPDREAYLFLVDGETEGPSLTYRELDRRARAIAAFLQSRFQRGDRALLLYPPGLEFVAAFCGCLYAGVIAVPAYPPRRNRLQNRLLAIIGDAQPAVILGDSGLVARCASISREALGLSDLPWIATDDLPAGIEDDCEDLGIASADLAFLQYTSGSTSTPKGVMVSHGNLIHNERIIQQACGHTAESVLVSWLPVYHDMGLIGTVLQPLYVGCRCILMASMAFLQQPVRWLRAISRYRATTSGGPNFAYELCLGKVSQEQRRELDLSAWKVAFNGAEPVVAGTLERFAEGFADCGFSRAAAYPCFGLAEATLFVTGGDRNSEPVVQGFETAELEADRFVETEASGSAVRRLVSCGEPLLGLTVRIVHPETRRLCPPDRVGEIWVSGDSVAQGYWGRPEATEETFRAQIADSGEGPFLRTGDLGFLCQDGLYVTGRLKDLIIIRGRNIYPQDIEETAGRCHTALRPGSGAAFALDGGEGELLIVVQEIDRRREKEAGVAAQAVLSSVTEEFEARPHDVVIVRAGTIPKTSSGKIQRHACREAYQEGRLMVVGLAVAATAAGKTAEVVISRAVLRGAEEPVRRTLMIAFLRQEAGRLIGVQPRKVQLRRPLTSLGFDSLMAIDLQHRLESALEIEVFLGALLEASGLAEVAQELLSQIGREDPTEVTALLAVPREASLPQLLSYGQEGLWFVSRLTPANSAYNIPALARIAKPPAPLLRPAFEQAVAALVDRHAALRATFFAVNGEARQRFSALGKAEILWLDSWESNPQKALARAHQEAYRPFHLDSGPLLRIVVWEGGSEGPVLLFVIHHIVADFWSLTILLQELGQLYHGAVSGKPASLEPLELEYQDYVEWSRRRLEGDAGKQGQAYWRRELEGRLDPLELPTDRPRTPVQSSRGGACRVEGEKDLLERLEIFSAHHGATLFMTLLAAYQALLYRYSNQDDILVGTPTSGRNHPALAPLVGYFVNPIVVRGDFAGGPGFKALTEQLRDRILASFAHQDYPFPLLTEHLQPARDPSRSPIFQTLFLFQQPPRSAEPELAAFALGWPGKRASVGGWVLDSLPLEEQRALGDMTLSTARVGDRLLASLQFNRDLFDPSTAQRMVKHFVDLLQSALDEPLIPLTELSFLSAGERHQAVVEWNDSQVSWSSETSSLHGFVEDQARRTPDREALVFQEEILTYRNLDVRASRFAARLRKAGVSPGDLVAVGVHRSLDLVIAVLGVLKAGAAYVPLDPSYPEGRMAYILQDSGAKVVIFGEAEARRWAGEGITILGPESEAAEASDEHGPRPGARVDPQAAAYMIYTSGSTGKPKGVVVSHGAVSNLLHSMSRELGIHRDDTLVSVTTISFDISVLEVFLPLKQGAKVVLADAVTAADGRLLMELVRQSGATVLQGTPTTWRLLVEAGWRPPRPLLALSGGEVLTPSLAMDLVERTGQLWNLYGPTETTIYSAGQRVRPGSRQVLLGRPIANTEVYITDFHQEPCAVGVAGEMLIGGEGLAWGYLGRPAMTAERFIPDAVSLASGARLYRTGDLATTVPDGQLKFLGRLDHQVKVRGFRIELGEVEAALSGLPGVERAVVVARPGPAGDDCLAAYLIGTGGDSEDPAALRARLAELLPAYMVPSSLYWLDGLPLTPSGKVDRRALMLRKEDDASDGDFELPATPAEASLVAIWSELFGQRMVSSTANFFALGGHSLLALRLTARVQAAFGVELPVDAVFRKPTPRELATELLTADLSVGSIPSLQERDGLPLSVAQHRLWLLDQLRPGNAAYSLAGHGRLEGRLDSRRLEQALRQVVRRHEALRTSFPAEQGNPVQRIAESWQSHLSTVDLSGIEAHRRQRLAEIRIAAEADRAFDLERDALLRLHLLRLGPDSSLILVTMHHIVSDGVSLGLFVRDLEEFYQALLEGREPALPELPVQYGDYADWQRNRLQGPGLKAQEAFWKERLSPAPPVLELPTDRPRPALPGNLGGEVRAIFPPNLGADLKRAAASINASSYICLLAAFQAYLARMSHQGSFAVGSPIANRDRVEVEGLVGFFVNTLVMRAQVGPRVSYQDLLEQVRNEALGAFSHSHFPFERLLELVATDRDPSRHPLFQVFCQFSEENPLPRLHLAGLKEASVQRVVRRAKFDLELTMFAGEEWSEAFLEYNRGLFDPSTAERMVRHFVRLLQGAVDDPSVPVAELSLLSVAERHQSVVEWNASGLAWRSEALSLHGFVEDQVRRTPDRDALVFQDEVLTYRSLDARASSLATRLRQAGVGQGDLVAVCLHRSLDLVVALLGVLKAGAAYVPLDPGFPEGRLEYILEDSAAKVVIAREVEACRWAGEGILVLGPETGEEAAYGHEEARAGARVAPLAAAYVIYTSGSTGKPKGVVVPHGAVLNFLHSMTREPGIRREDTLVSVTTISFDIAVLEIFLPLTCGARVVLADAATAADGRRLAKLLDQSGATIMQGTPATWRLLLEAGWRPLGPLRALCGGEVLSPSLAEALLERLDELWNLYGPTETTVWSAVQRVRPGMGRVLLGRPIANTGLYVTDRLQRPRAVGVPGEVLIAGAGLARGYQGRPGMTAERFIPDALSGARGARLYRSGDLAATVAGGQLRFLGRLDRQVKVRGFRVELGEVEAALSGLPGVERAVVVPRPGPAGDDYLVAYLLGSGSDREEPAALRGRLAELLPAYMLPSFVRWLDELPMTPNGKIDRRALMLRQEEGSVAGAFEPAATPAEASLMVIWSELFGQPQVSSTANFFALGGHSLLALRLTSRIQATFGVELPVDVVFRKPTPRELAIELATADRSTGSIQALEKRDGLPLSLAQHRLWLLDQLQPGNTAYLLAGHVWLEGRLSSQRLERALHQVVRRHEALRTSFPAERGSAVQRIAESWQSHLSTVDLTGIEPSQRQELAEIHLAAEADRAFDLERDALLRVHLLRLGPKSSLLLVTMHHIVSDGFSLGLLVRDLEEFYAALLEGREPALPKLPVQAGDYAVWQRNRFQGVGLEVQETFWKERLSPPPPPLELPTDRPRPALPSYLGAGVRATFPPHLGADLKRAATSINASSYICLLAAFQAYLARLSHQYNFAVGTPIANRDRVEVESLVGFFVNTLIMRAQGGPGDSFQDLLEQVRNEALGAFAHSQVPFERLIELVATDRDPSRHPLFQVFFQFSEENPLPRLHLAGLKEASVERVVRRVKFDLELTLFAGHEGLEAFLEYNRDLFDDSTARRWLGDFRSFLERVLRSPAVPLREVSLLSASQRHQLLHEWRGPHLHRAAVGVGTLPHHVEAQARRTPDRVAVRDHRGLSLTYEGLNTRANRLARKLRSLGIATDDLVAVLMERSTDLVVALLGILKAGAAYLPLDRDQPEDRLEFMLVDSKAPIVVSRRQEHGSLAGLGADRSWLYVDEDESWNHLEDHDLGLRIQAENLAYCIYTSGSTGRPKGVLCSHGGIVNRLQWMQDAYGLTVEDRILQKTPFSFDVSVWEFFWPLMFGAELVMARPGGHKDGKYLVETLAREQITVVHFVPSLLRVFLEEDGLGELNRLRLVVASGEALPLQILDRFRQRLGAKLENLYGPTEASVDVTHWSCRPQPAGLPVPIGRPIANTSIDVLDAGLYPVAFGAVGELAIGGVGLARGYLGRPGLTAERFVPDPWSRVLGGRIYRSGDLARWRSGGLLDYLGRTDFQVKVRGFRIELGEIDACLGLHPGISQGVSVVREERIIAFYVASEATGSELDPTEIRQFLSQRLPENMVPTYFVALETLPLTTSGKVDRKTLPDIDRSSFLGSRYVAPKGYRQVALAQIWGDLLNHGRVGAEDDFFELGGDSIISIQVVAEARRRGIQLSPGQLFQHRTVRDLAVVAVVAGEVEGEQGPATGPFPLTAVQRWFFDQRLVRPEHWNQALLLTVPSDLAPESLESAWKALLNHHDALRSRFEEIEEGWAATIEAPGGAVATAIEDFRHLSGQAFDEAVEKRATELQRGFDLTKGPLLCCAYFRAGQSGGDRLFLAAHHLVVDGVSWRILLEDLFAVWRQLQEGQTPSLPPKSSSYPAFAAALRASVAAGAFEEEKGFWLEQGSLSTARIPRDALVSTPGALAGVNLQSSVATVTRVLDESGTRALLLDLPRLRHRGVEEALLASLAAALARWTGRRGNRVAREGHGRGGEMGRIELSRTVGWFTSIYPLQLEVSTEAPDGLGLLDSIGTQMARVPGGGIGYGALRYLGDLETRSALAGQPQPEVIFNYLGQLDVRAGGEPGFRLLTGGTGESRSPEDLRRFVLELDCSVVDGRLSMVWTYSENLQQRSTVENLAEDLLRSLLGMVFELTSLETPSGAELGSADREAPLFEAGVEDRYALAPLQQGILFHMQLEGSPSLYLIQLRLDLLGRLDEGVLERSWNEVVNRHGILRTAFRWEDLDEAVQVVYRRVSLPFSVEDWRDLDTETRELRFETLLRADREIGFELQTPPLLRLRLLRMAQEEFRLVWSFHHLLLDGWSVPLVLKEVFETYRRLSEGRASPVVSRRPFRDYVAWLSERSPKAAEAFWRERLAGFRTPLSLGGGRSSVEGAGNSFGRVDRRLDPPSSRALTARCRELGITLATLVQGAWALLLARYGDVDDVVFGATTAGRPTELEGSEAMLGMFINTLPVRVQVQPQSCVLDWLRELQIQGAQARQFEDTPLVQIQAWSEVPRELPLFETLLVVENYPLEYTAGWRAGSLEVSRAESLEGTHYPLTLVVEPGEEIVLKVGYRGDRFVRQEAERLLGYFLTLLNGLCRVSAQASLAEVPLFAEAEVEERRRCWGAQAPYVPGDSLQLLFEQQAAATPEAPAVEFQGEILTFQELNRQANRLAHLLRKLGVGPEMKVGICLEPGLAMAVALFGILKAGGAYIALDPNYPLARLTAQLEDCPVSVIVTEGAHAGSLPQTSARRVLLDEAEAWPATAEENPPCVVADDHLAYLILTSGTTGRPKAVMVEHGSLRNFFLANQALMGWKAEDRVLCTASIAFDIFLMEFLCPILAGGCSVLVPLQPVVDIDLVMAEMPSTTVLIAVPSMIRQVVDLAGPDATFPAMRRVAIGGDKVPAEVLNQVSRLFPRAQRMVGYGPTEATVICTHYQLPEGPVDPRALIGVPLANAAVEIFDSRGRWVPEGVGGEIYIGGSAVARGYWNRPELTQERFVSVAGERFYRTGDLARFTWDGQLEFLGRIDHQIKIRGHRIEVGEVEVALGQHGGVRESVVVAVEDDRGEKRLVAYFVPTAADSVASAELRSFVGKLLPPAMVPEVLVPLQALPLGAGGKIDRKALPVPAFHREVTEVATGSLTEELLSGIFGEVLNVARVGLEDSFFELGGHSLVATRVLSRIRQVLGVELPVRALFEAPTVAELAVRVEEALAGSCRELVPELLPVPTGGEAPASFAQQRLFFFDRLNPGQATYNVYLAVSMKGDLDHEKLMGSLQALIDRHESLRTTMREEDGRIQPRTNAQSAWAWQKETVTADTVDDRKAKARKRVLAEIQTPFDLEAGPLFRALLLKLGKELHVLVLTMHHLVTDGWSMGIFLRELAVLYNGAVAGRAAELPVLALRYADYAHWQRQWFDGGGLQEQIAYWKEALAGAPALLELPVDRPRPARQSLRGARLQRTLDADFSRTLESLARRHQSTLFMALLASFAAVLGRYSGQEDLVIGSPIANRRWKVLEGIVGLFINSQALRLDLSGDPTFSQLLERVRRVSLEAYAHQDLPFEKLVEELHIERDPSRSPVFQTMLALNNTPLDVPQLSGLEIELLPVSISSSRFDLGLAVDLGEQGLTLSVEYATDLFDRTTIERFLRRLEGFVRAAVQGPDSPLSTLAQLPPAEGQQLLVEWNDHVYPLEPRPFAQLFEQQVDRSPQALALIAYDGLELTYAELDRQANRLARILRRRGVGPELTVGLALERSLEAMISILAVHKAGGAYVPLDPAYPRNRLDTMIKDSGTALLISRHRLEAKLPAELPEVLWMEELLPRLQEEDPARLEVTVHPDNLAYIIYTSGSTGRPKGVLVPHRGLANLVHLHQHVLEQKAGDRVLQLSSLSFDISLFEIAAGLCTGATLCLAPPEGLLAGEELVRWLMERRVSTAVLPPPVLAMLPVDSLPDLDTLVVGGEACSAELASQWAPGRRFFNGYGPTETTIATTMDRCHLDGRRPPIGRPVSNFQAYVVDRRLRPVPQGTYGELVASGTGIVRGYRGRPGVSAERFVPNPFARHPGDRLYRTGDLVRYGADGRLEFAGRIDHQVKLRGFRIELGEVETALGRDPAIKEVAAIVREDTPGVRRLVAYLVTHEGAAGKLGGDALGALRRRLAAELPDYMIPAALVELEALPLTPNGKVDRKALPQPTFQRGDLQGELVAATNRVEEVLAECWKDVLGLEEVGIQDNFFELGGDSILSLQVVSRGREAGLRLSAKDLFEHQTIEELATVVQAGPAIRAEQETLAGPLLLTPVQRWFFEQDLSARHHWNQSVLLEVPADLDPQALERALAALVEHHDGLRLRFDLRGGGVEASYGETCTTEAGDGVEVQVVDLADVAASDRGMRLVQTTAALQGSLDLERGPLLRAAYFDYGPEVPGRLFLVIHHLAVDGVSWRILLEDLQAVYGRVALGKVPALPRKTTSLRTWAQRLANHAEGDALEGELERWFGEHRGQVPLLPGSDRVAGVDNIEAAAASVSGTLSAEETYDLLSTLPERLGARVNEVLLAALVDAFGHWSGERRILVDLEGHGREELFEDVDLSRTVGWFTTFFPVIFDAQEEAEGIETLEKVKQVLREIPHGGLGYGLLRYLRQPGQGPGPLLSLPPAPVSFNYLGQVDRGSGRGGFQLASETVAPDHDPRSRRPHLLDVGVVVRGGRFEAEIRYCQDLHRRQEAEELLEAFLQSLRNFLRLGKTAALPTLALDDFLGAELEEDDLEALLAKYGDSD